MKKSKMVPNSKLPLALRNYETLDRAGRKLPKRNFPGHRYRKCVYCDKVGPRTKVLSITKRYRMRSGRWFTGSVTMWAHKRCLL